MIRRDERGLTLIEVAVVLAIVTILGVATHSVLGNVLETMRVRGAAEQLATAIRLARQSAITSGEYRCITLNGSPPAYAITVASDSTTCTSGAVLGLVTTGAIGDGNPLTFSSLPSELIFDPVGRTYDPPSSTPANSTFAVDTNPPSCLTSITVTLYGGVKVQKCA